MHQVLTPSPRQKAPGTAQAPLLPRSERQGLFVFLAIWFVFGCAVYAAKTTGCDLLPLILAARLVARGLDSSLYARSADGLYVDDPGWLADAAALGYDGIVFPFLYPPLVAYALFPFAHIDFAWLRIAAAAIEVGAIGAAVVLTAWQWNRDWLRPVPMLLLLFGLGLTIPFIAGAVALNVQTLVIFLIVVAMIACQRDRPALAGIALALAAGIKILPGVIAIYWLASRRYDCVAWFAAGLATFVAASLVVGGVALNLDYLANAKELSNTLVPLWSNKGLPVLLYGLAGGAIDRVETFRMVHLEQWISITNLIVLMGGLAFILSAARRYRDIARKVAITVAEKAADFSSKFPSIVIQNT